MVAFLTELSLEMDSELSKEVLPPQEARRVNEARAMMICLVFVACILFGNAANIGVGEGISKRNRFPLRQQRNKNPS